MTDLDFLRTELLSRYGTVKRARGCFLYTAKGVRLTDMYQEGGRAILGWGSGSAFTMFKNTMNRGLTGGFPSDYPYRTQKAVSELLGSKRNLLFYYSKEQALKASLLISSDSTAFYRPWNAQKVDWSDVKSVVLVPPLAWCEPVYIVAFTEPLSEELSLLIPPHVTLPAALHAGIARSIYDLIAALAEREEKHFFIYDKILTAYWERKGPYLFPKVPQEYYKDFAVHCLAQGIVISPYYNEPSIIPFSADIGVFSKLKNAPFAVSQEVGEAQ